MPYPIKVYGSGTGIGGGGVGSGSGCVRSTGGGAVVQAPAGGAAPGEEPVASGSERTGGAAEAPDPVKRYVRCGASPRAAQAIINSAKVYALLDQLEPIEQDAETFRPVKSLFPWPLGLALLLSACLTVAALPWRGLFRGPGSGPDRRELPA